MGSVLYSQGKTKVLCTASLDEGVPRWMRDQGRGWLTAEYSLLPASTGERTQREASAGQAEGPHGRDPAADRPGAARGDRLRGARRADALARLRRAPGRRRHALRGDLGRVGRGARGRSARLGLSRALPESVAAVSLGIVGGELLLDLDYVEDSGAEVDLNVVMTGDERLVEVQATAERAPFDRDQLDELLDLGATGIATIREAQEAALDAARLRSRRSTGRRSCGASSWPRGSAARSASSGSCASARPGFRTHLLVSVGSGLFTLVSAYGFQRVPSAAARRPPTRRGSPRRS